MAYYKNFQTKNKYSAVKTIMFGKKFDSKKEARYSIYLEAEKQKGNIKSWDTQKRIDLYGENGNRVCYYKADFEVIHNDGTIEIIDVKSKATVTSTFRLKWKLLEDKYKTEIKNGTVKLTIQY